MKLIDYINHSINQTKLILENIELNSCSQQHSLDDYLSTIVKNIDRWAIRQSHLNINDNLTSLCLRHAVISTDLDVFNHLDIFSLKNKLLAFETAKNFINPEYEVMDNDSDFKLKNAQKFSAKELLIKNLTNIIDKINLSEKFLLGRNIYSFKFNNQQDIYDEFQKILDESFKEEEDFYLKDADILYCYTMEYWNPKSNAILWNRVPKSLKKIIFTNPHSFYISILLNNDINCHLNTLPISIFDIQSGKAVISNIDEKLGMFNFSDAKIKKMKNRFAKKLAKYDVYDYSTTILKSDIIINDDDFKRKMNMEVFN